MPSDSPADSLALWGGFECTVNRIGNRWLSQLDRAGADDISRDALERVAALGIRTLRFPILWERTCPDGGAPDWRWADARMQWMRELGITPIVGLVHHGSGPSHTSLIDPDFPTKLAAFAGMVAQRYPWVEHWTPVNEPLTTARFSGLYGVWYPHARDPRIFGDCLLNQMRGVVEAMRAIERVVPNAKLVQTDDLGTTYSTPALAYQAGFHNQLRWLSWDLLCGKVDAEHPLWTFLTRKCGLAPANLRWFGANVRKPDIVGINHYITSDRFLDERLSLYPPHLHGGNGRDRYADVEAVRVHAAPEADIRRLLEAAWHRYGLPLAITEMHIDATREDQLRWIAEMWRGAGEAREAGVDVRAVTAWALLGTYDWNSLLTIEANYYEPGAFDARGGRLRPTAVATLLGTLAKEARAHATAPVLEGTGWWRRANRAFYPPRGVDEDIASMTPSDARPILITGGAGTLGRAFARMCARRDLPHRVLCRRDLDIADAGAIGRALDVVRPWAVINAAGYVRVDDAERDEARCFRENTDGAHRLAAACAQRNVRLATFSSDLVFDGRKAAPYEEDDTPAPLNVYGRSKAEAETRVLDVNPDALVVRTSAFFGPWDAYNFVHGTLEALRNGESVEAASDVFVSPTYVPDLVDTCLDLLIDGESGIRHLANGGAITWMDLALRAAELANVDASRLRGRPGSALRMPARRPAYSALRSARCHAMPTLEDALVRYSTTLKIRQGAVG